MYINEYAGFKKLFEETSRPVVGILQKLGVTANQITIFGLFSGILASVFIIADRWGISATWLFIAGVTDVLDGALARHSKSETPFGDFVDGVSDRVVDVVLFSALCWYFSQTNLVIFALLLVSYGSSMLTSFIKARADSVGAKSRNVGPGGKSERFIIIFLALLFPTQSFGIFLFLAVISILTVIMRMIHYAFELAHNH